MPSWPMDTQHPIENKVVALDEYDELHTNWRCLNRSTDGYLPNRVSGSNINKFMLIFRPKYNAKLYEKILKEHNRTRLDLIDE